MQIVLGSNALSQFNQKRLLKSLQTVDPSIKKVSATFVHLVNAKKKMTGDQLNQLEQLLTYGESSSATQSGDTFFVIPRIGTISPWSSKATEIVRGSGLTDIQRVERGTLYSISSDFSLDRAAIETVLYDQMTEQVVGSIDEATALFKEAKPKKLRRVDISGDGKTKLKKANVDLGLALADDEIDYLFAAYKDLKRDPTDAELMMFAQVNSEHCRHKIFNADWIIDGKPAEKSLFEMIKNTYQHHSVDILSAYSDNAAVLRGPNADRFFADADSGAYSYHNEPIHLVTKVETHNHPTAIAPFPGAATGVGGEIRDEGATGRGAKPKMGLAGFNVSNLNIPGATRPWEGESSKPGRITSPLDIMIDAPIGAASYNNEFGRPNLTGYFRTYEQSIPLLDPSTTWGYHKPIMAAGGLGNIRDEHVQKQAIPVGAHIIVLGGPAMLIGLGGGAASSMQAGASKESLDFASVQRANAEVEHRVQEVIDAAWAMGSNNPIVSIHDVGAGGLSNALPELVHDAGVGAKFELRDVPNAEPGLSPMEIWCNEAQERYVLAVADSDIEAFKALCARERCPYAIVGKSTKEDRLLVTDRLLGDSPVDLPMSVLFGKPPKMTRQFTSSTPSLPEFDDQNITIKDAVERVLKLPAVASKKFLITIGDRTIGGLVTRDQMIGKWQVPVSDAAVTASSFHGRSGEAMAMGERPMIALIDAASSARMAVGEAITNIASVSIKKLSDIKLSANWMAAAGYKHEDENLYNAVRAIGQEFAPIINLTIPVGKDSLSMRTVWQENGKDKSVTSPMSLVITAFSPVDDITQTLTPELKNVDSSLILIDLGAGSNRMGGSALAQVYNQIGNTAPDIQPAVLKKFFDVIQTLRDSNKILAYHDRSDGGLFATLSEMMFASRLGIITDISNLGDVPLHSLFNEELGAVIQISSANLRDVEKTLRSALGSELVHTIGTVNESQNLIVTVEGKIVYQNSRSALESWWADTSYQIQSIRDNAIYAKQEFKAIADNDDPGLIAAVSVSKKKGTFKTRPKVAIFREQGVNGQVEMAAAFDRAGFTSVDVHMQDLMDGRASLSDFVGLVACGGFSYGDVLGAGEGWAKSILFHKKLRQEFSDFFTRPDTFSLGVCNGCQMLSALKEIIPGTDTWPRFLKNASEQFEARLVNVRINDSPSIFFKGMEGSILPVPTAHGEGRAVFESTKQMNKALSNNLVSWQYVDGDKGVTEVYPKNPNGSKQGITALTTPDGRVTITMPHPERVFLSSRLSWHPDDWDEDSPWMQMFHNARKWVDKNS